MDIVQVIIGWEAEDPTRRLILIVDGHGAPFRVFLRDGLDPHDINGSGERDDLIDAIHTAIMRALPPEQIVRACIEAGVPREYVPDMFLLLRTFVYRMYDEASG